MVMGTCGLNGFLQVSTVLARLVTLGKTKLRNERGSCQGVFENLPKQIENHQQQVQSVGIKNPGYLGFSLVNYLANLSGTGNL